MKIVFLVLSIIFLLPLSVFAENMCPYCQFKNTENDRYCLSCFKEIRGMTAEEKKELADEDSKYKARKKKLIDTKLNLKPNLTTILFMQQ